MNYEEIKTFEDACKALGISPENLPVVTMLPAADQQAIIAHYKLIKIAEAINGGWQPDWNNYDQRKFSPWFEIEASADKPSGFGFSTTTCDSWSTFTLVGSRLCYETREKALYAGKQFAELYQIYFLISK